MLSITPVSFLKTAAAIELVCAMATKPAITDGRSTGKNDGVPDRH
jgi:hypothetical protein